MWRGPFAYGHATATRIFRGEDMGGHHTSRPWAPPPHGDDRPGGEGKACERREPGPDGRPACPQIVRLGDRARSNRDKGGAAVGDRDGRCRVPPGGGGSGRRRGTTVRDGHPRVVADGDATDRARGGGLIGCPRGGDGGC